MSLYVSKFELLQNRNQEAMQSINFRMSFSLLLGLLLLGACNKENFETETIVEEEVVPEVVLVNSNEGCEESEITITSDIVDLDLTAVAYLLKDECNGNVDSYVHNYLVVLEPNFDLFFLGSPIGIPSGGIPGISFGSNGAPAAGDVLTQYAVDHFESFLIPDWDNPLQSRWLVDETTTITITTTGDEVDETIGGTISGNLTNYLDPNDTASFTGSFCATIIKVCD